MNRYVVPAIGIALLVTLMAVVGVGCSQQASLAQAGPRVDPVASPSAGPGELGRMFPGLEGIPPDQLFDHFMGGQFSLTDRKGVPFTIKITPGTVTTVTTSAITITPNGQTTTQTFDITPNTIVHAQPDPGSIEAIVEGDKVVIMTRDAGMDAIFIAKHGPTFHRRMMDSMMQ